VKVWHQNRNETLASEETSTEGWTMAWSIEQNHRETAEHAAILTPVEARQGLISGRIILVLAATLTLVVIAFALIYALGSGF
jgi:hypothetical protein